MKIKFNSDSDFPLNKKIKIPHAAIVVRDVFDENSNYES